MVSRSAKALDLAGGLHALAGLRYVFGDTITAVLEASPNNYVPSRDWPNSEYERWIEAQLKRLRNARMYLVQGIGASRAVWVTIPARDGKVLTTIMGKK